MHTSAPVAAPRLVWAVWVVAVVVGSVAIAPYVLLDTAAGRLAVLGELHYALLVGHIVTAMVALVLGPLQFVPAIRARRGWHRRIGRTYLLAGVLPSGLLGIPVALLSERVLTQVGLLIPAVAWLVTAGLAVRAIRRGDVEGHRSWMARNYALTFLAVTARILVPLMLLAQAPFAAPAPDPAAAVPVGQVLGWVVNLVIVEIVVRRRRALAPVHPSKEQS